MRSTHLSIALGSVALVVPVSDATGVLITALKDAQVFTMNWDSKLTACDTEVTVRFLDPSALAEIPEPIVKAMAEASTAKQDWLKEYNKRTTAEKELSALRKTLADKGITIEETNEKD